jgi:hypothetical protein
MRFISKVIQNFLSKVGITSDQKIQMVPKSSAGIRPGDFVFFKYDNKQVVLLVVSPVVKDAKTGNRLFTGFKVPPGGDYTPESLEALYKNKELPRDNYRTYILSKIQGPVRRIK